MSNQVLGNSIMPSPDAAVTISVIALSSMNILSIAIAGVPVAFVKRINHLFVFTELPVIVIWLGGVASMPVRLKSMQSLAVVPSNGDTTTLLNRLPDMVRLEEPRCNDVCESYVAASSSAISRMRMLFAFTMINRESINLSLLLNLLPTTRMFQLCFRLRSETSVWLFENMLLAIEQSTHTP